MRLKLTAHGIAQCTNDQSRVWYHLAIQAPQFKYEKKYTENVREAFKFLFIQLVSQNVKLVEVRELVD